MILIEKQTRNKIHAKKEQSSEETRNIYITHYHVINTEYQLFTFHFISFCLHLYVLLYKFRKNINS